MAKKDKEKKKPKLFRILIFLGLAGGLVYWLSTMVEIGSIDEGKVKGQKVSIGEGQASVDEINEQINKILPGVVKKQIEKINERFQEKGGEVFKSTEEIVKETKLADEIEKIINQTTDEIEGFPEKQKEEIKKAIIRQVCEALMTKIEDDENKE